MVSVFGDSQGFCHDTQEPPCIEDKEFDETFVYVQAEAKDIGGKNLAKKRVKNGRKLLILLSLSTVKS